MMLLLALLASASSNPRAQAVRAATPPSVDGRLDDPAWQAAPPLDGFVQVEPNEGAAASEPTEVRIVYDQRALYVGFRCWDSRASQIAPRLGRRDAVPESDWVSVIVDPSPDRRSAYYFLVNSAGVVGDGVVIEGQGDSGDWDGVWTARTSIDDRGWSAEIEIPFSTLRFPRSGRQSWGIHVRRYISRLKETDDWNLIRRTDASQVGRFAQLDGIEGVQPGLSLQVSPYASATVRASAGPDTLAPQSETRAQVGLDVKYALTGTLTLDATINPDFGQVEVDPEVVNLSAFEVFFPEKRPFFLEGLDIFQSAGSLVYTRRIGAPPAVPDPPDPDGTIVAIDPIARIVGALKLTGNAGPGTAVGLLAGYVDETSAVERIGGPGNLSPTVKLRASPASFFQAARVRRVVRGQSTVGLTETAVVRGSAPDAVVLGSDFDVRGRSDWTASGSVSVSATDTCKDVRPGAHCDPAALGLAAGKTGGTLRLWDELRYLGADYDINDLGFLQHQLGNQLVWQRAHAGFFRMRPLGPWNYVWLDLSYATAWDPNAGGGAFGTPMTDHFIGADFTSGLRNHWEWGWFYGHAFARFDDAETRLNPLTRLYHRSDFDTIWQRVRSNPSRPFWLQLRNALDVEGGRWTWAPGADANALLGGRVQLGLSLTWRQWFGRPRWIDTAADGYPLFGTLDLEQLEATLRATAAFSREVTLQLFSQFLRSAQRYPRVWELLDPFTPPCQDGACLPNPSAYDRDLTSLIINAVLRWEFHPGSTAYLVYTHNHQVRGVGDQLALGHALDALGSTPADNVIALKLTYLWAL
ncbi:MAG TPA: DUF5916 domain-containing protein [Polyangia bacterium]|nr:DUF5916 domain-containing protein [Polyangia bacterium]